MNFNDDSDEQFSDENASKGVVKVVSAAGPGWGLIPEIEPPKVRKLLPKMLTMKEKQINKLLNPESQDDENKEDNPKIVNPWNSKKV